MGTTKAELTRIYRGYMDCLNRRDWPSLAAFVGERVHYNERLIGLSGDREMLEGDVRAIPDLVVEVQVLLVDSPRIASRVVFDGTPTGTLSACR